MCFLVLVLFRALTESTEAPALTSITTSLATISWSESSASAVTRRPGAAINRAIIVNPAIVAFFMFALFESTLLDFMIPTSDLVYGASPSFYFTQVLPSLPQLESRLGRPAGVALKYHLRL